MLNRQIRQWFERLRQLGKGRPLLIDDGALGKATRRSLLVTGATFLPFILTGCMGVRRDRVRLARRPLVEDIATTYMNFTGRLQFADGREFDLIDMPDDDCFSPSGDATWVRDFVNDYKNEAMATDADPIFIARYRRLSTYFFIVHPNLARHLNI